MDKVETVESWYTTSDNNELFTRTWKAVGDIKAKLVLVHGFGEHSGRYDELLKHFASHGIESYSWDQRGFGETAKKSNDQGNAQGWDTVLGDVDDAVLRHQQDGIPLFLMGHSMGGGIILSYLTQGNRYEGAAKLTGSIASAPLVQVTNPPPAPVFFALRYVASVIVPNLHYGVGLDPSGISRDPVEVEDYKADPLVKDTATLATLKDMLANGELLLKTSAKITTPVLVTHGTVDHINKFAATKEMYEHISSSDKNLLAFEGCYHELHHEVADVKEKVTKDYIDWIEAHL
ncbi:Alpha/Beta hydrolase protein [Umbelopsis sp. PMI_123]|nr:Alpha/Beta hydrolase protein [Umbelopsis sp. PMI_123]